MAPIKVWELCGADKARVFSPFCWATRLAVLHKGLECETVPWWACRSLTSSFSTTLLNTTVDTAEDCWKEQLLWIPHLVTRCFTTSSNGTR